MDRKTPSHWAVTPEWSDLSYGAFHGAAAELCCTSTSEVSLTHRVLCRGRTAASMPALRTEWETLSRQKWWSCRRTRVPTPPRWSAASTQWCSRSATSPAWRADISPRNPPCSRTEAPRRWNRIRKLKNKGCTGRKLNYRGPFFGLLILSALCVLERLRLRSGGRETRRSSIRRCCKLMSRAEALGLSILSLSRLWRCSHPQQLYKYLSVNCDISFNCDSAVFDTCTWLYQLILAFHWRSTKKTLRIMILPASGYCLHKKIF